MYKDIIKRLIEQDPFLKTLGVKVISFSNGRCKISVEFKESLTRTGGIMNGGAIATLADAAGGCAVLTCNEGNDQVTVDLDISFLRPIRKGPVTAEAKVTKKGISISFADISIFDGSKTLCAIAKGTWFFMGKLPRKD